MDLALLLVAAARLSAECGTGAIREATATALRNLADEIADNASGVDVICDLDGYDCFDEDVHEMLEQRIQCVMRALKLISLYKD
jgi:hypothetical protein